MPLYEWIVRKAREHGLAGATVLRGIEGFGAHSRVHTAKLLRLSTDLQIVVEIVDSLEKIEAFLPAIDGAIREGLATLERVQVRFYRSGTEQPDGIANMDRKRNPLRVADHRRSGIMSKPMVARTASAAPKRNGADGPYQSHRSPAIRLAGSAATPKAALKIP